MGNANPVIFQLGHGPEDLPPRTRTEGHLSSSHGLDHLLSPGAQLTFQERM